MHQKNPYEVPYCDIGDYEPVGECEVLHTKHVGMRHPDGSTVVIPTDSLARIADHPEILRTIDTVAQYAARNNGFRDAAGIIQTLGYTILKAVPQDIDLDPRGVANVYKTADGSAVIKAFDRSTKPREPIAQYAVMAALCQSLIEAQIDDFETVRLSSPTQYAIVQSPTVKHRTIIMEAVAGEPLRSHFWKFQTDKNNPVMAGLLPAAKAIITDAVKRQVAPELTKYMNDVTFSFANVLIPSDLHVNAPLLVSELQEMLGSVTIIDQPHYRQPETVIQQWLDDMGQISSLLNSRG